MTVLIQELNHTFPDVIECESLSEALDEITRFDRAQVIDLETGIVRVYNREHVLAYEDTIANREDFFCD